eukprot:1558-Chlamydomonas_euryale.AAC.2
MRGTSRPASGACPGLGHAAFGTAWRQRWQQRGGLPHGCPGRPPGCPAGSRRGLPPRCLASSRGGLPPRSRLPHECWLGRAASRVGLPFDANAGSARRGRGRERGRRGGAVGCGAGAVEGRDHEVRSGGTGGRVVVACGGSKRWGGMSLRYTG